MLQFPAFIRRGRVGRGIGCQGCRTCLADAKHLEGLSGSHSDLGNFVGWEDALGAWQNAQEGLKCLTWMPVGNLLQAPNERTI